MFEFTIFYLGAGGTISTCLMPEWRNRQTRQVEGLVGLISRAGSTPVPGIFYILRTCINFAFLTTFQFSVPVVNRRRACLVRDCAGLYRTRSGAAKYITYKRGKVKLGRTVIVE